MTGCTRVVVVGLGNPVRTDDAVGLVVARELERLLQAEPVEGVTVRTGERAGFEILDLVSGADRAVIVDCLDVESPLPGRTRMLSVSGVSGSARLVGGHDVPVGAALHLARLLDRDVPDRVEIVGIEGADTTTLQETLTPPVAAAVPGIVRWLHRRLRDDTREPPPV